MSVKVLLPVWVEGVVGVVLVCVGLFAVVDCAMMYPATPASRMAMMSIAARVMVSLVFFDSWGVGSVGFVLLA